MNTTINKNTSLGTALLATMFLSLCLTAVSWPAQAAGDEAGELLKGSMFAGLAPHSELTDTKQAESNPGRRIAGTWKVEVIPDSDAGIPPITNIASFDRTGQVVNLDPGLGSSVGRWARFAHGQYAFRFTGFAAEDGSRYVVTAFATLDSGAMKLSGRFHTRFLDPDGNQTFDFVGEIVLTRI